MVKVVQRTSLFITMFVVGLITVTTANAKNAIVPKESCPECPPITLVTDPARLPVLEGTSWTLTFMQNESEDRYIYPVSSISLGFSSSGIFGSDGESLVGNAGCNNYGVNYTLGMGEIETSSGFRTAMECGWTLTFVDETDLTPVTDTTGVMEIEDFYLSFIFSNTIEYNITDEGSLVLCDQTALAVFNPADSEDTSISDEQPESYTCSLCEMDFCSDDSVDTSAATVPLDVSNNVPTAVNLVQNEMTSSFSVLWIIAVVIPLLSYPIIRHKIHSNRC